MLLANDNECYMPQFRGKIGTKEKKKMKKASFVTYFFYRKVWFIFCFV